MAKVDLSNAYRSVRIHPSNYSATGLKWLFANEDRPRFFVDTRLPFGASRSPFIFNSITQSVRRMMAKRGFSNVVVYLDDFLIIERTLSACNAALHTLLNLLRRLGFHVNYSKLEGPSQIVTFLGVTINSINMSLSLPQQKLTQLADQLTVFSNRKRATCNQLQSLAGKLAWASRVVRGGRTFLRRILDAIPTIRKPSHKVKLTHAFQEDITWWRNFLHHFNGTAACTVPAAITDVHVDACNSGSGVAFGNDWQYVNWRCDWPAAANLHINHKETLSFLIAARRWAHIWSNHRIIIYTDSMTAMSIINKGTSRNKLVMAALRELFWLSAIFNFEIKAAFIPGSSNTLSDTISRLLEPGQLASLFSLTYLYASPVTLATFLDALPYHITYSASRLLSSQINPLCRWSATWMPTLLSTGVMHLPQTQKRPTRLS